MARGATALLALQLLRGAQSQCINSAGDANCATYVGRNCDAVLAGTLTVGDVCEKACGRCGTLLEADAKASCFACVDSSGDADGNNSINTRHPPCGQPEERRTPVVVIRIPNARGESD